jgi:CheY-like chemotaxis protein
MGWTNDTTIWVYLIAFIVSAIGFLIFLWWWVKNRRATIVYAYVTALFGSEAAILACEIYARALHNMGDPLYYQILDSQWWAMRYTLHILLMAFILFHIISRIKNTLQKIRALDARQYAKTNKEFKEEVLVVEDNQGVCDSLKDGLKTAFPNIVVYCCPTAECALEEFVNHPDINLVISDINLPEMNGFELCKIIKQRCPWTVVIGMTGYQSKYELWNAREIGFDDYIVKPFHLMDMITSVRREFEKLSRWKKIRRERRKQQKVIGNSH